MCVMLGGVHVQPVRGVVHAGAAEVVVEFGGEKRVIVSIEDLIDYLGVECRFRAAVPDVRSGGGVGAVRWRGSRRLAHAMEAGKRIIVARPRG